VGGYVHFMFLNDHPPATGGRELWGFPKKLASPTLEVDCDTLVGTLDYGPVRIATGTMGFKHRELDHATVMRSLNEPGFLLKIVPHVDGSPRVCELVRYYLKDIVLKCAWTGPAALELYPSPRFGPNRGSTGAGGDLSDALDRRSDACAGRGCARLPRMRRWVDSDVAMDGSARRRGRSRIDLDDRCEQCRKHSGPPMYPI
jgi:hypothetical protein